MRWCSGQNGGVSPTTTMSSLPAASRTGRYLGLLAASMEQAAATSRSCNIDTCFIAATAQDLDLFQRMLAVVVLRMEGMDAAPSVISACTGNPECLRGTAQPGRPVVPARCCSPSCDSSVVTLATARPGTADRAAYRAAPEWTWPTGQAAGRRASR